LERRANFNKHKTVNRSTKQVKEILLNSKEAVGIVRENEKAINQFEDPK
jgi:hypothetical protein